MRKDGSKDKAADEDLEHKKYQVQASYLECVERCQVLKQTIERRVYDQVIEGAFTVLEAEIQYLGTRLQKLGVNTDEIS